jgi:hypothetical protein
MEAIAPPIQAILDLFATALADVRFADLDATALANLADEVRSVAELVVSAQAALASAEEALRERQGALLKQVQRAVAYARVYAESDEVLTQRLESVALPRSERQARSADKQLTTLPGQQAARPRGRPRKIADAGLTLTGVVHVDDGGEKLTVS